MKPRAFRRGIHCAVLLLAAGAVAAPAQQKAAAEQESPLSKDQAAQKQTIKDIRNVGTAMFSWLTDQVSAGAAGQAQTKEDDRKIRLGEYPRISHADLVKILVPVYLSEVPAEDGWGHPYEYSLNVEDPLARQVMAIRSPGRDGAFSGDDYGVSSFALDDFDQDIVWTDGFFTRWPQAPGR